MTVKEYNAMHEAKGTPKVWVVDYALRSPSLISSMIFATEEEATAFVDGLAARYAFVEVRRTWDIWNWTKRHSK